MDPTVQQITSVPIYFNWSFWAVVVAAAAIILSQMPPVHQLLRKAKLTLELHSRVHLSHKIGNPNIQLHIIIANVGGRRVRIKGVNLSILKDGKCITVLPAQGYLQNSNDKNAVLFTGFNLKAREEWGHIVNFFNPFSRTDEKKYRAAELALKKDILSKGNLPENKNKLVEADARYVWPLQAMCDDKFIWGSGEYELSVTAGSNDLKLSVKKNYRFTLFESDEEDLKRVREDFKFGDGVYWDSANHLGIIVPLIEV